MELDARVVTSEPAAPLVVADWKIDAEVVAERCRQHLGEGAALRVVVPAWLHGLDWAGDPFASVPCARIDLRVGSCSSRQAATSAPSTIRRIPVLPSLTR